MDATKPARNAPQAAAALPAGHREPFDDDHAIVDPDDRFDTIPEHLEALGERTTRQLAHDKGLDPTWHDWSAVRRTRRILAAVAKETLA